MVYCISDSSYLIIYKDHFRSFVYGGCWCWLTFTNEVSLYVTLLGPNTLHGYVCSCGVLAMTQVKCEQVSRVCGCEGNDQVSCAEGITRNHKLLKEDCREPCWEINAIHFVWEDSASVHHGGIRMHLCDITVQCNGSVNVASVRTKWPQKCEFYMC